MTTTSNDSAAAPAYIPAITFDSRAEADAQALLDRVMAHYQNKTTESAEGQWLEPVDNYSDEALFEAEKELIFKRIPLPLALTCEMPEPNSRKAVEIMGIPVVITRDAKGAVHAMLNVCRHRGALICEPGVSKGRTLTCPYHAWAYNMEGDLVGVYGEDTFGEFDREERKLVALPCEERHGLIFVILTPGLEMNLDEWLGDFGPILASLKLEETYHFSTRMMPGPNWKVVIEGFLEGYHFAALHKNTVMKTNLGNTSAWNCFGPHQRIAFALRGILDLEKMPREEQNPIVGVGPIVWTFPGFAIAGGWRDRMAVAFVMPGQKIDESMTEQRILLRRPPANDHEVEEAAIARDWFYDVTYGEDYLTGYGVQKGVKVVPGTTQIFGRNEPGVQHVHRTINDIMTKNHAKMGRPELPLPRTAG